MTAHVVTRRTALGAGLAAASVACVVGPAAYGETGARAPEARSIDALLIDESVAMPRQIAAFIEARKRTVPVVGIALDAAGYGNLKRVLGRSSTIIGISSGATLFCLERIGWDHGFRLIGRSQRCHDDLNDEDCRQDVVAFLNAAHPFAASAFPLARGYRPSREDGTLHAWAMTKSVGAHPRQGRGEV